MSEVKELLKSTVHQGSDMVEKAERHGLAGRDTGRRNIIKFHMHKLSLAYVIVIASQALAADYGDVNAIVSHVHDGDTVIVDVNGWPDICGKKIPIRINGIDCPELNDKNPKIRGWAYAAKDKSSSMMSPGTEIKLHAMDRDARFRIDATVIVNGVDVGAELIKSGYAKKYNGKGRRPVWTEADVK